MIMDCLRYWVSELHVDGFRFDLAAVLSRDEKGYPLPNPPILWEIESDPVLAGTKIIAEAWDAGGLYQVGSFIGDRWAEWNGKFRDDVRRFVKSDPGFVSAMASRILGSPDLYRAPNRDTDRSVNFITAHDGFTLNDLVSYNDKHNDANGEGNTDGESSNNSWNSGWEGPSTDPYVERLREKQIRNFLTILLVSQGTPMIVMGDEVRRSQGGNNNVYGQDNEIGWFNWEDVEKHAELHRFTRGLIKFVQEHKIFHKDQFWSSLDEHHDMSITWHGTRLGQPDWSENSRVLAFSLGHVDGGDYLHVMLNSYWDSLPFELPPLKGKERWSRIVDTALDSPNDYCDKGKHQLISGSEYWVEGHAAVILLAHEDKTK
jgi:glycogen operon protein